MGRGKIKHEIKREKRFSLGRNARGGREQDTAAFEKTQRVCARANKEEATQERKRKESSQEGAA